MFPPAMMSAPIVVIANVHRVCVLARKLYICMLEPHFHL